MKPDELLLLGSGCGIPIDKHSPPCFMLNFGSKTILIDIGYDTLKNIIYLPYVELIEDIFITHTHPDHFWGLIPLIFYFKCLSQTGSKCINIYGDVRVKDFLDFIKNYYTWFEKPPEIFFREVNVSKVYNIGGIEVKTIKTAHSDDSFGYAFLNGEKKVVFTGDTEFFEQLAIFSKDAYILVGECSSVFYKKGHMNVFDFETLVEKSNVKKAVLVHSYREEGMEEALEKLKESLGEKLVIGFDGLSITF